MGTIVVTTNLTLDGVVQDPDGEEGFTRGGWFGQFGGTDLEAWTKLETDEALGADALLLGRTSDEWFASRWPRDRRLGRPPEHHAQVRGVLDPPSRRWGNGTVLPGDVASEVAKVKDEVDGEILVYASYQLVRTLLEHDLVDELRLVDLPGRGRRRQAPLRRHHRPEAAATRRTPKPSATA